MWRSPTSPAGSSACSVRLLSTTRTGSRICPGRCVRRSSSLPRPRRLAALLRLLSLVDDGQLEALAGLDEEQLQALLAPQEPDEPAADQGAHP